MLFLLPSCNPGSSWAGSFTIDCNGVRIAVLLRKVHQHSQLLLWKLQNLIPNERSVVTNCYRNNFDFTQRFLVLLTDKILFPGE